MRARARVIDVGCTARRNRLLAFMILRSCRQLYQGVCHEKKKPPGPSGGASVAAFGLAAVCGVGFGRRGRDAGDSATCPSV
jgi:MYXO-CTERM domain-containing protein